MSYTKANWKLYYKKNRTHIKKKTKAYKTKNRTATLERYRVNARKRAAASKMEMLQAYGGKCACCGETEIVFLTTDHIFGGGRKHSNGSHSLRRWLRERGWPKDKFQLLCINCNLGKAIIGICPHKLSPDERKQYVRDWLAGKRLIRHP